MCPLCESRAAEPRAMHSGRRLGSLETRNTGPASLGERERCASHPVSRLPRANRRLKCWLETFVASVWRVSCVASQVRECLENIAVAALIQPSTVSHSSFDGKMAEKGSEREKIRKRPTVTPSPKDAQRVAAGQGHEGRKISWKTACVALQRRPATQPPCPGPEWFLPSRARCKMLTRGQRKSPKCLLFTRWCKNACIRKSC
ncbi:hypothetical protein B0T24DRAFT_620354 [Lasiosphaeria ovina]|uniref:Uncharacterized protein n=1 Tax=Lasiosphaeria ovina TaxID=92902 RepID=A0AAE0KIS6_9PEZI|nr:hypothetical protein B0T24DRAFT_620354 [Lasiosphaeria ovina]